MCLFLRTAILWVCFTPLLHFGQTDSLSHGRQSSCIDKHYLKSYLTDSRDILISPVRWNISQWAGATTVVTATLILFTQDEAIQGWMQQNRTPTLDRINRIFFEPIGSGLYTLPALGLLYGCGFIWHNDRAKITALRGVEAYILAGVTSEMIKHLTHRHRPNQDVPPDPWAWDGPFEGFKYTSFPSGHAATAFAVATVIATSYQRTIWVPIICYSLATCAALARIYDNQHWASDVLLGSAIGFAIGKLVVRNDRRLKVLPLSPAGPGVSLVYRF